MESDGRVAGFSQALVCLLLEFVLVTGLVFVAVFSPLFRHDAFADSSVPQDADAAIALESSSAIQIQLAQIWNRDQNTYWTTDGNPCPGSVLSDGTCHSKCWYGNYQCKGYASQVFYELFGVASIGAYNEGNRALIENPSGAYMIAYIPTGDLDSDDAAVVQRAFADAAPGDFVQMQQRNADNAHSMIVYSVDGGGITVLECNTDGRCGIYRNYYSWASFASSKAGFSIYRACGYNPQPSGYSDSDLWAKASTTAVKCGYKTTFKCRVGGSGSATLGYQWQYSTNDGANWKNVTVAGGKTADYSVLATASRSTRLWRCVVTASDGRVATTSAIGIEVMLKATAVTTPAAGGSLQSFTVATTGYGNCAVARRWQVSKDGGATWANSTAATATAKTLKVTATKARAKAGWLYRCVVTAGGAWTTMTEPLAIQVK